MCSGMRFFSKKSGKITKSKERRLKKMHRYTAYEFLQINMEKKTNMLKFLQATCNLIRKKL